MLDVASCESTTRSSERPVKLGLLSSRGAEDELPLIYGPILEASELRRAPHKLVTTIHAMSQVGRCREMS